jgi:hypothetical protein
MAEAASGSADVPSASGGVVGGGLDVRPPGDSQLLAERLANEASRCFETSGPPVGVADSRMGSRLVLPFAITVTSSTGTDFESNPVIPAKERHPGG